MCLAARAIWTGFSVIVFGSRSRLLFACSATISQNRVTLDYAMMTFSMPINADDEDELFFCLNACGRVASKRLSTFGYPAGVRQGHLSPEEEIRGHETASCGLEDCASASPSRPAFLSARGSWAFHEATSNTITPLSWNHQGFARLLEQHEQLHGRYRYGEGLRFDIQNPHRGPRAVLEVGHFLQDGSYGPRHC